MNEFIHQYGAFLFGLCIGLSFRFSWLAHMVPGLRILIQIDGERLK